MPPGVNSAKDTEQSVGSADKGDIPEKKNEIFPKYVLLQPIFFPVSTRFASG